MRADDPHTPAWRRAAEELSDELRAIIEALGRHELSEDDLLEATRLAREIRGRLEGPPPRPRWYDAKEAAPWTTSRASREAYLQQNPIQGHLNPIAPPLEVERVERPDGSRAIVGRARLGMRYEGPPHGVHGGWVAALFDEVLGAAQELADAPGVTAILRVRFRNVTPLDEDLRFEAWIADQRERRLVAKATCHAGDTLTADAEGVFVRVDFNEVQERMQARRSSRSAAATDGVGGPE
jgi:acyl-coenzyme A thioesterase PaaI-like protein